MIAYIQIVIAVIQFLRTAAPLIAELIHAAEEAFGPGNGPQKLKYVVDEMRETVADAPDKTPAFEKIEPRLTRHIDVQVARFFPKPIEVK